MILHNIQKLKAADKKLIPYFYIISSINNRNKINNKISEHHLYLDYNHLHSSLLFSSSLSPKKFSSFLIQSSSEPGLVCPPSVGIGVMVILDRSWWYLVQNYFTRQPNCLLWQIYQRCMFRRISQGLAYQRLGQVYLVGQFQRCQDSYFYQVIFIYLIGFYSLSSKRFDSCFYSFFI